MNELFYYLVTTLESGRTGWFVVQLENRVKLHLLKEYVRKNIGYNVADLGKVLYAGREEKAPPELLEEINAEHGTRFSN